MIQNPFEQILPSIQAPDYRHADYDNQARAFQELNKGNAKSIADLVDGSMTDTVLKQTAFIAEGDRYMQRKKLGAASHYYRCAADLGKTQEPLTPFTLESKIKLSYALMSDDRLSAAAANLENVPASNRASNDVRYALSFIYAQQHAKRQDTKALVQAIHELESIKKNAPEEIKVLNLLGYLYDKKGDIKHALECYQQSFNIKPDKSTANSLKVLYRIEESKLRIPDYEKASKYAQVMPLINEGIVLKKAKKFDEASQKFLNALFIASEGVGIDTRLIESEKMQAIKTRLLGGHIQKKPNDALLIKSYISLINANVQQDNELLPGAVKVLAKIQKAYPNKELNAMLANCYNFYSK